MLPFRHGEHISPPRLCVLKMMLSEREAKAFLLVECENKTKSNLDASRYHCTASEKQFKLFITNRTGPGLPGSPVG